MSGDAVAASRRFSLPPAAGFLLRAALWMVGLFGLLRLPWVERALLVPFADAQLGLACALTGAPRNGIVIDTSCTGSDALALCLGAILAFPAPWRRRLAGCVVGFAALTALNTLRIGHLATVVDRPELFRLLHLHVWPAVLVLAAAGLVLLWMLRAAAPRTAAADDSPRDGARRAVPRLPRGAARFAVTAPVLVALYYLAAPWILDGGALLVAGQAVATAAGWLMTAAGATVRVSSNALMTSHGSWIVTQECVATPLAAVYLAAVIAFAGSRRRLVVGLLATVPLFLALAVARLLVLAVPQALVGSHLVAVHAFYQVLAAVAATAVAGRLASAAPGRIAAALATGLAVALPLQGLAQWALPDLLPWRDPQGALVLLPAFQAGLLAALLVAIRPRAGRRALAACWLGLALSQVVVLGALSLAATRLGLAGPVVAIRALALAVPLGLAAALAARGWRAAGDWPASTARPAAEERG